MAAVELSACGPGLSGGGVSDTSPGGSKISACGRALGKEDGELLRAEGDVCPADVRRSRRPPAELSLRETPEAEPESVSVMDEEFEGRALAVTKDKKSPVKRLFGEPCATESGERINALAKINGLAGEQNAELRNKLNHQVSR